eukprot:5613257-Pleurochrysis_carterae.AAC.2
MRPVRYNGTANVRTTAVARTHGPSESAQIRGERIEQYQRRRAALDARASSASVRAARSGVNERRTPMYGDPPVDDATSA